MQGKSVAAKAFRVGGLADFLYAQDIAFEVRPAELALALVVFQVTGTAVAAKDSLTLGRRSTGLLVCDTFASPLFSVRSFLNNQASTIFGMSS